MATENSSIAAFKVWIFPSLVSIVSILIWNDVNEIKADIKILMAQSNIDKTRIDNIERELFRKASLPENSEDQEYKPFQLVAVIPNNKYNIVKNEL